MSAKSKWLKFALKFLHLVFNDDGDDGDDGDDDDGDRVEDVDKEVLEVVRQFSDLNCFEISFTSYCQNYGKKNLFGLALLNKSENHSLDDFIFGLFYYCLLLSKAMVKSLTEVLNSGFSL